MFLFKKGFWLRVIMVMFVLVFLYFSLGLAECAMLCLTGKDVPLQALTLSLEEGVLRIVFSGVHYELDLRELIEVAANYFQHFQD